MFEDNLGSREESGHVAVMAAHMGGISFGAVGEMGVVLWHREGVHVCS